ncbi:MAG: DUF418 domain-containing protein [Phycisphaerales bacterium]|nr:DUF418 domain-containing protein [Phycisphaerales bacterium]
MVTSLNPVAPSSRHEIVDIVRGFALLGVLVANLVYTAQWFATPEEVLAALPTAALNEIVDLFLVVFVDFKFLTLFSMLFGLGLALQIRRAQARGQAFAPTFLRRMILLWIIGVAHSTLIWSGDILQYYAMVGVVLLLLSRLSIRTIVVTAIVLGVLCSLLPVLSWVLHAVAPEVDSIPEAAGDINPKYLVITEGSYLDIIRMNVAITLNDYASVVTDVANSSLYWFLVPLWKAMLGYAIGATGLHERSDDLLRLAKRWLPWTLVLGLAGSLIPAIALIGWGLWLTEGGLVARLLWVLVEFAAVLLAIAYACVLVILWNRGGVARVLGLLAPVGRMALTNYIMQSVLFILVLYGIGLGLVGEIGATGCVIVSLVIFAAQAALSGWWLTVFRFGPLEWAWRSMTYWKLQPMRRT